MGAIKLIHRIRVVFVGKGIERSLPYEIEEEVVACLLYTSDAADD